MATVTVAAGTGGQSVSLTFDTQANAVLAQKLAAAIAAGVDSGLIIPADSKDGPPPSVPSGKAGEFIQSTSGTTILPPGYQAVISVASDPIITGSGGKGQTVLASSTSDLQFFDAGGTGTAVAGGGGNRIVLSTQQQTPPVTSPPPQPSELLPGWSINAGNGNDTIVSTNGRSDTINAGGGHNALQIGSDDLVLSTGDDTVVASGSTSDTIMATGAHATDLIYGSVSNIYFVSDGGSATIFGGSGSDTFFGGKGPDLVHGGTGGDNYLFAGTGQATLFGGGEGDQLLAAGTENQVLHAGVGNETLFGGFGSGNNTFFAGAGADQIAGGTGKDTFVAGTGSATITGATGNDLFLFTKGQAGGTDLITDFTSGADTVGLVGYGKNEASLALKSQQIVAGSTTITLSDSTKITFTGVTNLKPGDFS